MNVLDPAFARKQINVFEQDKAHSHEITLEMLKHEPIWNKVLNEVVRPLEPEL